MGLTRLTTTRIVRWARAHFKRHGAWPLIESGPIPESARDDWRCIDNALRIGSRGLRPGRSLPQLLAERCGVRNLPGTPRLSVDQILAWADAHYATYGKWPTRASGVIGANPNETWHRLDNALRNGCRGLPGSMSLATLLQEHRGARHKLRLPRLTTKQIVQWAESHVDATGRCPTPDSGPIAAAPGETWRAVQQALVEGLRGLRGGTSLAKLLRGAGLRRTKRAERTHARSE